MHLTLYSLKPGRLRRKFGFSEKMHLPLETLYQVAAVVPTMEVLSLLLWLLFAAFVI